MDLEFIYPASWNRVCGNDFARKYDVCHLKCFGRRPDWWVYTRARFACKYEERSSCHEDREREASDDCRRGTKLNCAVGHGINLVARGLLMRLTAILDVCKLCLVRRTIDIRLGGHQL